MENGSPSITAERVARRRAAHQVLDHPKVFEDPLALRILGADAESMKEWAPLSALRAFMAARSRFCEDQLAEALGRKVAQYVILGAGLDTFAYRNPHRDHALRVFEVDHPDTQAWKRSRLEAARIPVPPSVVFTPTDFERRSLSDELLRAGFSSDEPAFFSWLGVTPYLTAAAFRSTLDFIAKTPPGGGVVFDYAVKPELLSHVERFALSLLSKRVEAVAEPFRLFFDPQSLASELRSAGFEDFEDLNADEINQRYFTGRTDGLHISAGLARLISARL